MSYDLEEQEQIEALKAWWAKYGNFLLTVVTVVLLAFASWQGWNWYKRHQGGQASGYFEALQSAAVQGNLSQVSAASTTLRDDYAKTVYATRGALVAAQAQAVSGNLEQARDELDWVVRERAGDPLAPVARLRLAGVLLDLEQYDAALAQVSSPVAGYESLYADRRGDILYAQGKTAEARQAWQQALEQFEAGSPLRSVVQLKLDALGANAA